MVVPLPRISRIEGIVTREAAQPVAAAVIVPELAGPGRSTLLRGGAVSPPRSRPVYRRRLVVALGVAAVAVFIVAIMLRLFPLSGPTRVIYGLHDAVWLPLYSALWTATFPYGLIWLVPAGALLLFAMIEFLALAQPIRRLQIGMTTVLLRAGLEGFLVAMNRFAAYRAGTEGTLLAAIVTEGRDEALADVLAADPARLAGLQRYQRLLLMLRPTDRREGIAALEAMALAHCLDRKEDPNLRARLALLWPDLATLWADWTQPPRAGDAVLSAHDVAASLATLSAEEMALACLVHSLRLPPGDPLLLLWYSTWAEASYAAGVLAKTQHEAEALIQFEFWAARAEGAAARSTVDDLLSSALPGFTLLRDRGERAAWETGRAQNTGPGR